MLVGVSSHVIAGKSCAKRCDVAIRQTEAGSYSTEVSANEFVYVCAHVCVCVCVHVGGTITY